MTIPEYPFSGDVRLNLDEGYSNLRANTPISRVRLTNGAEAWLVTRYDDTRAILTDDRFVRSMVKGQDFTTSASNIPGKRSVVLPMSDPPEHTFVRRLVMKSFTNRRVELLRPSTAKIVDELLDRLSEANRPADIVQYLALPLPVRVISNLIGIPEPQQGLARTWSECLVSINSKSPEEVEKAKEECMRHLAYIIADRRNNPSDDLISGLIEAAEDNENGFTDEELLSVVTLLFIAGYESTVTQITNFVYTLLKNPARWQEIVTEPGLISSAVEELLRFVPVGFGGMPIRAKTDVEMAGAKIKAGDFVLLPKHLANRDERVYDRPEELDFRADRAPHLAFGFGAHHCVGASLARMELQLVLSRLSQRFPRLRLAMTEEDIEWRKGALMRGPRKLFVDW